MKIIQNEKGYTMLKEYYVNMGISSEVYDLGESILTELKSRFEKIDKIAEINQMKVLKALQDCKVSEACLLGTTGYYVILQIMLKIQEFIPLILF